jgi:hypothetical protein
LLPVEGAVLSLGSRLDRPIDVMSGHGAPSCRWGVTTNFLCQIRRIFVLVLAQQ